MIATYMLSDTSTAERLCTIRYACGRNAPTLSTPPTVPATVASVLNSSIWFHARRRSKPGLCCINPQQGAILARAFENNLRHRGDGGRAAVFERPEALALTLAETLGVPARLRFHVVGTEPHRDGGELDHVLAVA